MSARGGMGRRPAAVRVGLALAAVLLALAGVGAPWAPLPRAWADIPYMTDPDADWAAGELRGIQLLHADGTPVAPGETLDVNELLNDGLRVVHYSVRDFPVGQWGYTDDGETVSVRASGALQGADGSLPLLWLSDGTEVLAGDPILYGPSNELFAQTALCTNKKLTFAAGSLSNADSLTIEFWTQHTYSPRPGSTPADNSAYLTGVTYSFTFGLTGNNGEAEDGEGAAGAGDEAGGGDDEAREPSDFDTNVTKEPEDEETPDEPAHTGGSSDTSDEGAGSGQSCNGTSSTSQSYDSDSETAEADTSDAGKSSAAAATLGHARTPDEAERADEASMRASAEQRAADASASEGADDAVAGTGSASAASTEGASGQAGTLSGAALSDLGTLYGVAGARMGAGESPDEETPQPVRQIMEVEVTGIPYLWLALCAGCVAAAPAGCLARAGRMGFGMRAGSRLGLNGLSLIKD